MLILPDNTREIGLDECGRGCLAGPVVAAAVLWDPLWIDTHRELYERDLGMIRDSKKLSAIKRKRCETFIKAHATSWSVQHISERVIDDKNILEATYDAMHACLDDMRYNQQVVFDRIAVDGNRFRPWNDCEYACFVGGDDLRLSIASASILAKVSRDEYMETLPEADTYDWKKNKGYGTAKHIRAIREHGLCDRHRTSFKVKLD